MAAALDRHVSELERMSRSQRRWTLDRLISRAFEMKNIYAWDYNARLFTELRKRGAWPPSGG